MNTQKTLILEINNIISSGSNEECCFRIIPDRQKLIRHFWSILAFSTGYYHYYKIFKIQIKNTLRRNDDIYLCFQMVFTDFQLKINFSNELTILF